MSDQQYEGLSPGFAATCRQADAERRKAARATGNGTKTVPNDALADIIRIIHELGISTLSEPEMAPRIRALTPADQRCLRDWLRREKNCQDALIDRIVGNGHAPAPGNVIRLDRPPTGDWRLATINAQDLCDKKFPVVKFIVPGLFPEGVTLLVSRPKLGKSWLLLQIGSAVASGVIVLVEQKPDQEPLEGDVLYLNLEDGERRAQRRMTKLFGARRETWPARLTLATKWRRFDQGGLRDIRDWCGSVTKPTLVMIDTLKKVRPPKSRTQSDYDADYEASQGLQDLCHDLPGLAFIVAHHDRKMDAEDVFDTVSGTLGLTGGVDTIAILKKRAQGMTLHIEGRDLLEEVAKAVRFDREYCRWVVEGEAADVRQADERKRVLKILEAADEGLSTSEIVAGAGLVSRGAADVLLFRMLEDGQIERVRRGIYGLPGTRDQIKERVVEALSKKTSKKSKKERSELKPLKDQEGEPPSYDLTDLTHSKKNGPESKKPGVATREREPVDGRPVVTTLGDSASIPSESDGLDLPPFLDRRRNPPALGPEGDDLDDLIDPRLRQ